MDMTKVTESTDMNTDMHSYVVPVYLLSALILNTEKPDIINSTVIELLEQLSKSEKIKKIFAETSKNLTDAISEINKEIHLLLVPNTIIPVKDTQDSQIAIDFVEQFNAALSKYLTNENK